MSDGIGADTVAGKIIIAVVTALLVGGTSPWWIDEFFKGDSGPGNGTTRVDRDPPSSGGGGQNPGDPSSGNGGSGTRGSGSGQTGSSPSGCVIETEPLTTLRQAPSTGGREMLEVEPGSYRPTDYAIEDFAGTEKGWFQIETESQTGWVRDITPVIAEKTQECHSFVQSHVE